jgi:hypothetical protein
VFSLDLVRGAVRNVQRFKAYNCVRVIPEIDIWRAAQLMVKR